jgi:hypothetical protein
MIRGKSTKAISSDIAEGYVMVNPLFLKSFDLDSLKELHQEILKMQAEIRGEKFPYSDVKAIRWRNMRLQRLHSAASIIKNYARERRMPFF